jgi:WD40 repeat protein
VIRLGHDKSVLDVAFSLDGHYLATMSADRTVRLWEAATGQQRACLQYDNDLTTIALSADGQYLATASWDKIAHVWVVPHENHATCTAPREITRLQNAEGITAIAFSSDGKRLATVGWDNVVLEWPWQRDDLVSGACKNLNYRNLTPEEWLRYMGEHEAYRETCPRPPEPPSDQQRTKPALVAERG